MASDRAKELARKQKAEAKALKQAKRNSDDPRDWGMVKQITSTYKMTAEVDKPLPWLMAGSLLIPTVAFVLLGIFVIKPWWLWVWVGLMLGISLALLVMGRRARDAGYKRYAGQPGAAQVGLSLLDKKKWFSEPAIAVDRQQNSIHRLVGPGGLILVGDGPNPQHLLSTEAKRHQQVLYGVDVLTMVVGPAENQVPLDKLASTIKKLPTKLDGKQVEEVRYRLKALDAMRAKLPLPKGPLPTSVKGARKMTRGR